jgi:sec-independent protein translocase protein TatC
MNTEEKNPKPNDRRATLAEEKRSSREMGFLDHLEELRQTILYCVLTLVIACAVVMVFMKLFTGFLNWPLQVALGEDMRIVEVQPGFQAGALDEVGETNAVQSESSTRRQFGLITTSPMAVFSVILQVSFLGGVALALPFILYFIGKFVSPGLTPRELTVLRPGCVAAFALFLLGALFSYTVLVPASLRASIFFNELFGFQVLWSADRYYGLLVWMTIGIGISFEFPLLLTILVYLGVVDVERLRRYRPHSLVVFLIVGAIVTPTTDPFTFLILVLPMSLLYEISIWISARVDGRTKHHREAIGSA